MNQAATQSGAEVSARPDASASTEQPSVHDRLKAFLNPEPPKQQQQEQHALAASEEPAKDSKAPPQEAKADAEEQSEEEAEVTTEDAQTEEAQTLPTDVDSLAEALGWDLDKVLDLETKVKIDGKEGKVRLRDLVKSHQLEGHLNQKLMAHADERKAFEAERLTKSREIANKYLQLDAGIQTLQRALAGEYANVDWDRLRTENPLEFNAKYVEYQQKYAQMQEIGNLIAAEQQHAQQEAARQAQAYLQEQKQLLAAKIPEWSDDTRRNKDKAEILDYLKAYGVSKEEFEQIADHRQALIIRDAWNWHKLQKSKPAVLQKVKAAPKLLKPGTPQSRASQNSIALKQDRDRLRKSGNVRDAAKALQRLGIV